MRQSGASIVETMAVPPWHREEETPIGSYFVDYYVMGTRDLILSSFGCMVPNPWKLRRSK